MRFRLACSMAQKSPLDRLFGKKTFYQIQTVSWLALWTFLEGPFPQVSSVTQLCLTLCNPMDYCTPGFPVYHQLPELNQTHIQSRWCHLTVSSPVIPFSSCLQSFPASGSLQMSQFFTSGAQSIGVSASASVLPMNFQGWSSLGWAGWISLQSKGLSKVFSNTTIQKHQFSGVQLSL